MSFLDGWNPSYPKPTLTVRLRQTARFHGNLRVTLPGDSGADVTSGGPLGDERRLSTQQNLPTGPSYSPPLLELGSGFNLVPFARRGPGKKTVTQIPAAESASDC